MTTSVWARDVQFSTYPPLDADMSADVCVVGAGIAGLTTALLLSREGKRVVILEAREIAGGETGRTTAHIVTAHDDRFHHIESLIGVEKTALVAQSYVQATRFIETTARGSDLDCDFHRLDGFLFLSSGDSRETLERELETCRRVGLGNVELLDEAPGAPFQTGPCLRFPEQAVFHPLKYVAGLLKEISSRSAHIFCGTRVVDIAPGETCTVSTAEGKRVHCKQVVVATNSPMNTVVAIHTKQAAYRTFAIAATYPDDGFDALIWDTGEAYHYVRFGMTTNGMPQRLIIVGGEDHKTGQADDGSERLARLEAWARQRFPLMGTVAARWSGQVLEPIDGLPFLGEDRRNVYIITGDSGTGITHATIGALIINDLIMGRPNPWAGVYDPSRRTIATLGRYARENINALTQFVHWPVPHGSSSPDQQTSGSASITTSGLKRIGIYQGAAGPVHAVSLACKHVGCPLNWNSLEQSWDCPCHGSRYRYDGAVICAPAHSPLSKEEAPVES